MRHPYWHPILAGNTLDSLVFPIESVMSREWPETRTVTVDIQVCLTSPGCRKSRCMWLSCQCFSSHRRAGTVDLKRPRGWQIPQLSSERWPQELLLRPVGSRDTLIYFLSRKTLKFCQCKLCLFCACGSMLLRVLAFSSLWRLLVCETDPSVSRLWSCWQLYTQMDCLFN